MAKFDNQKKYWALKPLDTIPSAENLLTSIDPDDMAALLHMKQGVRRLIDLGP